MPERAWNIESKQEAILDDALLKCLVAHDRLGIKKETTLGWETEHSSLNPWLMMLGFIFQIPEMIPVYGPCHNSE